MVRTLASIHHEERISFPFSESATKPPSAKEFECVDRDRLLQILDEIGTIVGEERLYLGYEDAERFLQKMRVIATTAENEWLYQGRKLYEPQSGDGMIDRLNNPETEHTRKPRSTKESSDSIYRERGQARKP
jgi:hypothetical protein